MEREAEILPRNLLGRTTIGRRPAYEWAEKNFNDIKQKYNLERFGLNLNELEVHIIRYDENVVEFEAFEVINNEEVGFIAGFAKRELKMLVVFASLKDRFVRVRRDGYKEQSNEWVFITEN